MKKIYSIVLAMVLLVSVYAIPTYAQNDNIPFNFELKPHYGNSYSKSRFRQTRNPNNKWKVNLTYSSEGMGTKVTFWLAKKSNKNMASGTHTIKQGSGAHYYKATNVRNNTRVVLGAENNNNTPQSYYVSGYWDEETN